MSKFKVGDKVNFVGSEWRAYHGIDPEDVYRVTGADSGGSISVEPVTKGAREFLGAWYPLSGDWEIELTKEALTLEEHDKNLGRWRFDDRYVVYPIKYLGVTGSRSVKVFDEVLCKYYDRHEIPGEHSPATSVTPWVDKAAKAYFDKHPKSEPWHEAKVGEAWVITTENGGKGVALVTRGEMFETLDSYIPCTDPEITYAHKIYPPEF